MNIETLKNKITEKIGEEAIINSIFRTGSSLFCSNYKDTDYMVIIQNDTEPFSIVDRENKIDYFINSQKDRDTLLNFKPYYRPNRLYSINELFKQETTIYGDNTVNLDLFEKADDYKKALKEDLYKRCLNPNAYWVNDDKYCNKNLWWAILGLMMLENNSYQVTDQIKEIIQKCHDGVLDKSWEDWVIERI